MTPAERMRRYRARNKASGLKEVRHWISTNPAKAYSDHRFQDIRSLALHALVARKLQRDPRLLNFARRNVARWQKKRLSPSPALAEWQAILRRPLPEVLAFITDTSEQATRLRQSSPFAGVLAPEERKRVFDAFRA